MSAVDAGGRQAAWNQLFHIVRDQFPYSKMKGLTVKGGSVVSFNEVQYTFILGRGMEPPRPLPSDTSDAQWLRFMRFCSALQDGIVGEVHFTDGRPVLVSMRQPGMDLSALSAPELLVQGGESHAKNLITA